jgi:Trypsin-co-occurring domain 1
MVLKQEKLPVLLEGGTIAYVETTLLAGEEEVSNSLRSFDELQGSLVAIGKSLSSVMNELKPKSASVEFGIEIGLEAGKLTALLVQGVGKANLKITLSWNY